MAGRLEGKVAFITGVARGQGRSHALRLAAEGADVIGVDACTDIATAPYPGATVDDLAQTVAQVEALGRRILATQADVRDLAALTVAVDEGVEQLGRLDIVSANAGIFSLGAAHELTELQWTELVDINLNGVWRTCRATIPHLIHGRRGGSIVLTSSGAGLKGYPHIGHYVSAKHALVGLMRTLALELAPHNIRVNSLHPGNVATPMIHNETMFRMFRPDLENPTADDMAGPAAELSALKVPWIEPVDVSNALVFLVSDEARYLTGVALPVDAGNSIL